MDQTILSNTKQYLNILDSNVSFDDTLLTYISMALSYYTNLGVISNTEVLATTTWNEAFDLDHYMGYDQEVTSQFMFLKELLFLYVGRLFLPPKTIYENSIIKGREETLKWELANIRDFYDSPVTQTMV